MKKFIKLFGIFVVLFALVLKAQAYQVYGDVRTKRIPMGTKIELEMAQDVLSNSVDTGDMFTAFLTRDVRTQTAMILPRGTVVRGNVLSVKEPKMLSRAATLYLNFDHVVAPNGAQLPISAGLSGTYILDEKGGIKAGGNYGTAIKENWSKSGDIIKKSAKWGVTSGEEWFHGGKFLVTPISTIGGVIAGAGYFVYSDIAALFKKGKNVVLKKGDVFNILLLEALDVPVSE